MTTQYVLLRERRQPVHYKNNLKDLHCNNLNVDGDIVFDGSGGGITNLQDPTTNQGAATKIYVDNSINTAVTNINNTINNVSSNIVTQPATTSFASSVPLTTTSLSNVTLTGTGTTLTAGSTSVSFQLRFDANVSISVASNSVTFGIYVGGNLVTGSERTVYFTSNAATMSVACSGEFNNTGNISFAAEVRWRTTAGTATVGQRNFSIIRMRN